MDDAKIRERAERVNRLLDTPNKWFRIRVEAVLREAVAEERRAVRETLDAILAVGFTVATPHAALDMRRIAYEALAALDAREQRQHTGRCMASPGECICGEQEDAPKAEPHEYIPDRYDSRLDMCERCAGPRAAHRALEKARKAER